MISTAYSTDGRSFTFEVPLTGALPIGAYVTVTLDNGQVFIGQVLEESVAHIPLTEREPQGPRRFITGTGNLLAELSDGDSLRLDGSAVFGSASVMEAEAGVVRAHLESRLGSTVGLEVGEVQRLDKVIAPLHADGFGRHTFLCGQSGSGKTYTLGVILERLLLDTNIRIALADPNSDYVRLGTLQPQDKLGLGDADYRDLSSRYDKVSEGIYQFGGESSPLQLRVRFGNLTFEQQTMVLGLDPLKDPEDFNAFVRTVQSLTDSSNKSDSRYQSDRTRDYSIEDLLDKIRSSFDDDMRRLGLRIQNQGVANMDIWAAAGQPKVMEKVPADWRMMSLDLGSLPSQREGSIAAAAFLGMLWQTRHSRTPTVIVIDEAHNVCPQNPATPSQALATEHVVRIAGEGRKYGLYLLLSTQRPEKVHQNVLSQCDNLILMRMNSTADLRALNESFGYAPEALLNQAAGFGLGEGLAAGKIAPDPLLFKTGRRLSLEGGSDVPSTWAKSH